MMILGGLLTFLRHGRLLPHISMGKMLKTSFSQNILKSSKTFQLYKKHLIPKRYSPLLLGCIKIIKYINSFPLIALPEPVLSIFHEVFCQGGTENLFEWSCFTDQDGWVDIENHLHLQICQ